LRQSANIYNNTVEASLPEGSNKKKGLPVQSKRRLACSIKKKGLPAQTK
jgi:hypothetical protein